MYGMFLVRVSARLLLLLRCLLTVLCIPWMSRRSLDTAIRPWMYYCRVPLPSTSQSVDWDTSSVMNMVTMFYVRVSARLLLLLRCLLTVLCIPWMSRRSLDTAIRPWMYYCRVPLPSTKTCLAGVSTRTSSHVRSSPSAPAAGLSRSPPSPAASENHVPTAWRHGGGHVFERPTPSRKTGDDDE